MLPAFHREIADWWALVLQAATRPMHLANIVCRESTHLGFCNASGIVVGGLCLDPAQTVYNLVWRKPWPPNVITYLVPSTNLKGTLKNSNLELASLFLRDDTLLEAFPEACMAAPCSRSDNTPTVSWSTCEASTINLVVSNFLRIRALHSRKKY